ncbi:MAG: hypothetical protein Athens101410_607 [Parcubacteria group bacterium Athens1014_10]
MGECLDFNFKWLCLLNEIRTFFEEYPDSDF